jgi:hypothetical protein
MFPLPQSLSFVTDFVVVVTPNDIEKRKKDERNALEEQENENENEEEEEETRSALEKPNKLCQFKHGDHTEGRKVTYNKKNQLYARNCMLLCEFLFINMYKKFENKYYVMNQCVSLSIIS